MRKTIKFCTLSLGLLLFLGLPAHAQEITNPTEQQTYTTQTFISDLTQADVVYLGETHDNLLDHEAQLQIIQALHRRNPQIAIGMEMFQRPFQESIDRYLRGEISEAELRQQTQYDRRWGFPWANYAPILRFARENNLPVLALNTPTEITRQVAEKGLDSLDASDQQWIPPASEIRTDNSAYRQFLRPIYEDFHDGHTSSDGFENFFLAQVLWDETMADRVASFLSANPTYQVVVLAGQGHIVYGYGIPSRVARRMSRVNEFTQRLVLLNPDSEVQSESREAIADYFWVSPD